MGIVRGRHWRPVGRRKLDRLNPVKDRVDHVVVLMLENRSFDHLFGYLGLAGVPPPDGREYENPHDLTKPDASPVPPTASAKHLLRIDPPHSHDAAKRQMGAWNGTAYLMNGFVDAYRLKLAGKEHLPVVHWKRLTAVAVGLSPLVTAAGGTLVSRARSGDWRGLLTWTLPPMVALRAIADPVLRAADLRPWRVLLGVTGAGLTVGTGADGLRRFFAEPQWSVTPAVGATGLAAIGAVQLVRRNEQKKRRLDQALPAAEVGRSAELIMRCMPPGGVKVLGQLAATFTTCGRWFSSVPGATWPNRNFLHAGTSHQSVDIEVGFYHDRTLFEVLDDQRKLEGEHTTLTDPPWRIYREGMPQVMAFERLWKPELRGRWCDTSQFEDHCAQGKLATYSFIEPRHSDGRTNSMHPGNNEKNTDGSSDFARAEELVRRVYEALRCGTDELARRCVLVITFDEHGGFFDRESPPATVHPDRGAVVRHPLLSARRLVALFVEHRNAPFDFRRLGMRVPTVVVSSYVDSRVDLHTTYDHSSVIASVCDLFAPDQKRPGRSRSANSFWHLLTRSEPRDWPIISAPDYREGEGVEAADVGLEGIVLPTPTPPVRPARQDDDLIHQLRTLASKANALLDERNAPQPVTAEDLSPTERVSQRFQLWATGPDGAQQP